MQRGHIFGACKKEQASANYGLPPIWTIWTVWSSAWKVKPPTQFAMCKTENSRLIHCTAQGLCKYGEAALLLPVQHAANQTGGFASQDKLHSIRQSRISVMTSSLISGSSGEKVANPCFRGSRHSCQRLFANISKGSKFLNTFLCSCSCYCSLERHQHLVLSTN